MATTAPLKRIWLLAILVIFTGGWMAFDGAHALFRGDFVTPKSGEYAGQVGPWCAASALARRKLDEALPLFERAREADPLASFPYTLAGWGLLMSGKLEDGLRQIEDALSFEKEDASAIGALCIANVALGKFEEAIDAGQRGVAVTHRAPFFLGVLGWALAAAGRDGEARTILEELRARPAGSPTAVSEAWLLGVLGDADEAFDVLARAEEEHQGLLCYTGLPGFDALRSDARFAALSQRLEVSAA